jgi:hypothetical protein
MTHFLGRATFNEAFKVGLTDRRDPELIASMNTDNLDG